MIVYDIRNNEFLFVISFDFKSKKVTFEDEYGTLVEAGFWYVDNFIRYMCNLGDV